MLRGCRWIYISIVMEAEFHMKLQNLERHVCTILQLPFIQCLLQSLQSRFKCQSSIVFNLDVRTPFYY